ncbi:ribonuclease III [Nakamurella aerolata]|uniref:Ribonuclease 3 n=1 Tax=Nakamurella aerolata TaxID=1656892 RepID=A0A849AAI8_9ACTN|nr:ribonuclease III [Nakamurella aerolata]NNG37529.1 ribonuclease III [Nakamurella aerolata]
MSAARSAPASAAGIAPELHQQLTAKLGVDLDAELALLAMTHRSYAYEHGRIPDNERLEFLGDVVLSIVVTEKLYHEHTELPEGQLAKMRASIVNMNALAGVARSIGLGDMLLLGKGEESSGGRDKASILGDATEALIGALYLQHGLEPTRVVVLRLFDALISGAPLLGAGLDWKTSLQELVATRGMGPLEYRIEQSGPDHLKQFTAQVVVDGVPYGEPSTGRTKKEAEQRAAGNAYTALSEPDGSASEAAAAAGTDTVAGTDTAVDAGAATAAGDGAAAGAGAAGSERGAPGATPVPPADPGDSAGPAGPAGPPRG